MPITPRNPFYASLAAIEERLPDPDPIQESLDALGIVTNARLGEIAEILSQPADTSHQVAVEGKLERLIAAQEGSTAALNQIAANTAPAAAIRPQQGVALLVMLVDRSGSWDSRFGVSKVLSKTYGDRLQSLDGGRGGTKRTIDSFIRNAPATVAVDPLFRSVTSQDAEQFCLLVPLLLDAIDAAGPVVVDDPDPTAPATSVETTPAASIEAKPPSQGRGRNAGSSTMPDDKSKT